MKNTKRFIIPIFLFAGYVWVMGYVFQTANAQSAPIDLPTNGNGFAVVELFTSEGCSSCPPAEAHLNDLAVFADQNPNVKLYPLAFHVDYWNYLGWKDPFSQEMFTARQRAYAAKQRRGNIYTPQMIVNGVDQFVGSHRHKGTPLISKALSDLSPMANLSITSIENKKDGMTISYELMGDFNRQTAMLFALVESNLGTQVKRGENRGRTLIHHNVVRHLETAKAKKSDTVTIPYTINKKLSLIAFAQDRQTFEIIAATEKSLDM